MCVFFLFSLHREEPRMEPEAYAKLATRGDVLPPFYITDAHVKYRDQTGVPTQIEILLGRSPKL